MDKFNGDDIKSNSPRNIGIDLDSVPVLNLAFPSCLFQLNVFTDDKVTHSVFFASIFLSQLPMAELLKEAHHMLLYNAKVCRNVGMKSSLQSHIS